MFAQVRDSHIGDRFNRRDAESRSRADSRFRISKGVGRRGSRRLDSGFRVRNSHADLAEREGCGEADFARRIFVALGWKSL